MSGNWFKAIRNEEAIELLGANPNAFILLYMIAYRAQRRAGFNRHNLKPGEALIGDVRRMGLTDRKYRTAKDFLKKHGFATFQPTSRGTIGTLVNKRVFDVNIDSGDEPNDEQATSDRRAGDEQATTTKNAKKVKNAKNAKKDNACASGRNGFDPENAELPEHLRTDRFRSAWSDWCKDRKARKSPITEIAAKRQIKSLSELPEPNAVECIEKSLRSGWTGIFPENHIPASVKKTDYGKDGDRY